MLWALGMGDPRDVWEGRCDYGYAICVCGTAILCGFGVRREVRGESDYRKWEM